MELRPDILLFGIIVAIAFIVLGLVSVIRQATRNVSAHQRWMRGNYACYYDQYEEALSHYEAAASRLDEENAYINSHRVAVAYGLAATYFMMKRYELAVEHYAQSLSYLRSDQTLQWVAAEEAPPDPTLGAEAMWWAPVDYIESYVSSLCRSILACYRLGRVDQAAALRNHLREVGRHCGAHFRLEIAQVLHQEAVQLPIQYGALEMALEQKQVVYDLLRDDPGWSTGEFFELQLGLAESSANCGDLVQTHEMVSELLESALPPPLENFATVLAGNISCQAGELPTAINQYEHAIRLRTSMFGPGSSATAICRIVLADVLRVYGDYRVARETLAKGDAQSLSPDGEHRISACRVRAMLAAHEGDFDVVEEMFDVLMRDASISDSPMVLAETHLFEAYSWMTQDNEQFALQSAKSALQLAETIYPVDNALLCQYLTVCAWLSIPDSMDEARSWLDRAKTALGDQRQQYKLHELHVVQAEAEWALARGDYDAAKRHLEMLEREADRIFLPHSITHAQIQCLRGELCLATEEPLEAAQWLRSSLECRTRAGQPAVHPSRRHPLQKLADALRAVSDSEGVVVCERALEAIEKARRRPELRDTDNPYQA